MLGNRPWLDEQDRKAVSDIIFPGGWGAIPYHQNVSIHQQQEQPSAGGRMAAPIATPETLSEESVAGSSRNSSLRGANVYQLWRKEKKKLRNREPIHPNLYKAPNRQYSPPAGSDVCDMVTESSSVYCSSPLSSVRGTAAAASGSSRSQLKREIMRLYQRAAADVDQSSGARTTPGSDQPSSTNSRSPVEPGPGSSSNSSSPSSKHNQQFPVLDAGSLAVFGQVSPVSSRPATANGAATSGRQLYSPVKAILPPCNTSF